MTNKEGKVKITEFIINNNVTATTPKQAIKDCPCFECNNRCSYEFDPYCIFGECIMSK